jgi:hypothetical protein
MLHIRKFNCRYGEENSCSPCTYCELYNCVGRFYQVVCLGDTCMQCCQRCLLL